MKKYLIIPDVHAMNHDVKAWNTMYKVAKYTQPHGLIILGDFLDGEAVSFHSKDPERSGVLLRDEIKIANTLLDQLDKLNFKDKRFALGNHEFRVNRYIADKAPDLFGLVDVTSLMQLRERGYKVTPYMQYGRVGKLIYTHECGKSGINAITDALRKFDASVVHGHTHSFSMAVQGNARGEKHVGLCPGWLGNAKAAKYAHAIHKNINWSHGFGMADFRENGHVYLQPINILPNYTCFYNGKLYQG
jgi:predicted phosphodiesterase